MLMQRIWCFYMNDLDNPFVDNNNVDKDFIGNDTKTQNKSTRTPRKGIECVHCENIFDCNGHLGDLCLNFKARD